MARFMAVHTLPITEEQAAAMLKNPPRFPPGVVCNFTWDGLRRRQVLLRVGRAQLACRAMALVRQQLWPVAIS